MLALDGTLVNIGVTDKPPSIPSSLIVNRQSVASSRIGGIAGELIFEKRP